MKSMRALGLKTPILYMSPHNYANVELIEGINDLGGLGIVNCHKSPSGAHEPCKGRNRGIRISLEYLKKAPADLKTRLIVVPLEDIGLIKELERDYFSRFTAKVLVETGSGPQASQAQRAGASGVIAMANEGPGWVSETNGFVLLQEILKHTDLPVFLKGGVTPRTVRGAMAAGASGVILDVHLALCEESELSNSLKEFFVSLDGPITSCLCEGGERQLRIYSRVGAKTVRELLKEEEKLEESDHRAFRDKLEFYMGKQGDDPDRDDFLVPMSEDIHHCRERIKRGYSALEIMKEFISAMQAPGESQWPFTEGSPLALDHNSRFPIVQGPMAHVSDSGAFLAAVRAAGGAPCLALGNMPRDIAQRALSEARDAVGDDFGVGIIGLDVNREVYEAHLTLMENNPPRFVILAAGNVELARRIESMGVRCYMHSPSPATLKQAIQRGQRHFVIEGCESGGHVGLTGSLTLWSRSLDEIQAAIIDGIDPAQFSLLLAGGVAGPRASAFIGEMVGDIAQKGVKVGLQVGTAYLATKEAVDTGAITKAYQELTINAASTAILGRTVNTRARAAKSPMAKSLIKLESERLRMGVKIKERKELYEKDNLGALRLAAKGCAIDPKTAGGDCPAFMDLPEEEQLERGLYLMGQAVTLLSEPMSMKELHEDLCMAGERVLTENLSPPAKLPDAQEPRTNVMGHLKEEPIAVVGLGLRFPGSSSPREYWERIINLTDCLSEVPQSRWSDVSLYYDPDPKTPDKTYSKIGGFIEDFKFDSLKHRIPPSVSAGMDRNQQMAVASVADALEDAGLGPDSLRRSRVGVVLGACMGGEKTDQYAARVSFPNALKALEKTLNDTGAANGLREDLFERFKEEYLRRLPEITEDSLPGELPNVISGRVANVFNLTGPSFTVDAACASSLAAVMNGVGILRSGAADLVISGGVDAAMGPSSFIKFCKIGALSPDGSRPFDESANGFVMGEGAGIMILKRLGDAIRDQDKIYATIVGVGSSSDGKGKGITAPNAEGQKRAIRDCLESSGVDLGDIGLIEAHGTSTAVGDKTELKALDELLKDCAAAPGSVGLGSVKSQIGHLKAASGAAGMIKVILGLQNKTLPPTANITRPSACINWDESPLRLITAAQPWELRNGSLRRAGVSAFGFGGANYHVILQEHAPGVQFSTGKAKEAQAPIVTEKVRVHIPDWPKPKRMNVGAGAWVFEGRDYDDLAGKLNDTISVMNEENWPQLAKKSLVTDKGGPFSAGFAAADLEDSLKKLRLLQEALENPRKRSFLPARGIHLTTRDEARTKAGLALVFPGQGSQYTFMLRDLAERYPVAGKTLMEADSILEELGVIKATSLMFPDMDAPDFSEKDHEKAMTDTKLLQPLILTANVAIYRVLEEMGIKPLVSVMAGHSLGEYAACVASGVMPLKDALRAVAVRGKEMANVSMSDPGRMMSIPAEAGFVEEVLSQVNGYVVAANKNSPKQTVISGETRAVETAAQLFKERGLEATLVPVSAAFHSAVVASAREPFMETLKDLEVVTPGIPLISNVTGDFYPVGPAAGDRIRELLAKQFAAPVEWIKTVRRMYNEGVRIFLECGPKRVLTALGRDTLEKDALFMATNHPKKGGVLQLLETAAALKAEGLDIRIEPEVGAAPTQEIYSRSMAPKEPQEPEKAASEQSIISDDYEGLKHALGRELSEIVEKPDFRLFMELQGEPIRAFIKSGYENFVEKILPLERTNRVVESQGMDFQPVVVSGMSAGLPGDGRFPFDRERLDDLINGYNFIKRIPNDRMQSMLAKNIERLVKGENGEAELQRVHEMDDVIKLAGYFTEESILEEYGVEERMIQAMDISTRLALAAGLEALKDAQIPLVLNTRQTTTGKSLPDAWSLPAPLQRDTGVIFASAFPGVGSLIDEVTKEVASKYNSSANERLINFYTGLIESLDDPKRRSEVTKWFTREFSELNTSDEAEVYSFNRNFLFRVMTMAPGQLAQFIKAKGPNTHVNAACASTSQALVLARNWIRTGMAKRVLVVGADDAAGSTLLPWIGGGFLAMGAATTKDKVDEAALPFDSRRNGIILGSAAVGFVLESETSARERGVAGLASMEAGIVANSAYHGTRLDPDHISSLMQELIASWEKESGKNRDSLSRDMFFMSHETYSPKRGGSSAAEVQALRQTFGNNVVNIPIANTKGFTGHTMGAGVEDAVAIRCLQKAMLPPIPNLKSPDPDFADLKLGPGGPCEVNYALRLAAGFGSQIVMSLYKVGRRSENRIEDQVAHRSWLERITGYESPRTFQEDRILKVKPAEDEVRENLEKVSATDLVTDITALEKAPEPVKGRPAAQSEPDVQSRILRLLAAKTGYPVEMLDPDLDLEADLGIDTVKQAEFITEVREEFKIPEIKDLKIADFPTISKVVSFVNEKTGSSDDLNDEIHESGIEGKTQERVSETNDPKGRILELLAAKTGYPVEMLDPDLDLEADLGIDTVKQAEFITEVREEFKIPEIKDLKIADFPTIAHVAEFVRKNTALSPQPVENKRVRANVAVSPKGEINLYKCALVPLDLDKHTGFPGVDHIFIVGGSRDIEKALKKALKSQTRAKIHCVEEFKAKESMGRESVGIVNLLPLQPAEDRLTHTLQMLLNLAHTFENGPDFLLTAVSGDGAFGYKAPNHESGITGEIIGAVKAFGREYENSIVNVLDMDDALMDSQRAEVIVKALVNRFPMETSVNKDLQTFGLRLVPKITESEEETSPNSVILATGGAKGITAQCLKGLAKDNPRKFILIGRTRLTEKAKEAHAFSEDQWSMERERIIEAMKGNREPVTPVRVERELDRLRSQVEVYRTIKELEDLGSQVVYRDIDLSDSGMEEFAKELAADYPRIDYVIHGAGIDQSKALKSKTMEDMQRVIHPKAKGLASLLEALGSANIQVGKIIGFGSVSGRFGNRGQVDYSAANDGLAHYLRFIDRTSEMRAKIIHWPPWSDIGMASGGSVKAFLEEAGIDFISPGEGAEILKGEMTHWADSFEETVVCGRLGPFEWDAFHIPGLKVPAAVRLAGQEADIVSMIPDEFIRAKVLLSPGHPLLDHHRIDGTAILPGVGAIEIMRSATNLVSGGDRPLIKDVELKSPVKLFHDEPFTVEVRVNRRGALVYDARIVSRHMGPEGAPVGPERIHHECVLEYDTIAVESNERARLDDRESRDHSSWIPVSGIYRRFFHGPGFQFLNHLSFNSQGNRARFGIRDTGERPSMFNDNLPAIIEAAFQAAAGLAMERSWAMALPTGFRALSALGALDGPAYGFVELVREFDLKNMANRSGFEMDVTIFNAAGEEILKVQGIGLAGLSDPAAQNPWGYEKIYEEAVDLGEIEQLMSSPGKEAIGEILHQEEQTGLEGPKTQKRRLEWLGGRLAAKRAIRELLSRSGMKAPALNMMKLIPDESGRPVPALVNYDQPLDLHLSISHSHGRVIAAVTANPGVHGIGVDLEKIEPRTNSWARDYFNEEELKLANTLGAGDLALTMMWSIKEAALKAMGAGLRYDLKDMAVREIRENGAAVVDFQGDAARNPLAANGKDILIRVDSDGEMVVARALIEAK